jgi:hypothetical protein
MFGAAGTTRQRRGRDHGDRREIRNRIMGSLQTRIGYAR